MAVERIPNGTNLTRLTLKGVDPPQVVARLAERGVRMPAPAATGVVMLGVNETWTRRSAPELVAAFTDSLA